MGFESRLIPSQTEIPSDIVTAHSAAIKTIRWVRLPPVDTRHKLHLDWAPDYLLTVGWDGNLNFLDIRDPTLLNDVDSTFRCECYMPGWRLLEQEMLILLGHLFKITLQWPGIVSGTMSFGSIMSILQLCSNSEDIPSSHLYAHLGIADRS